MHITGETPSFLIVSFRYIGDLLVTTPLALSIKRRYPKARVEYLVFAGTEEVLAKNKYVDKVHIIPRGGWNLKDALRLFRKFDYALATNQSDRTTIWAALAGRKALGFTNRQRRDWWKSLFLARPLPYDDRNHVVHQILSLLEPLGIPLIPEITMAYNLEDELYVRASLPYEKYIIFHPYSRGHYKYWPAEKWGALAGYVLAKTGCVPVFTVTGAVADSDYLELILAHAPQGCRIFTEPMTLSQLAAALHLSAVYVGIDTMVTHLAAAVGTPTVTIFGPSFTRYWAPWPPGCTEKSPFAANRGVQRVTNVTVVQKDWDCVPCNKVSCRESSRDRIECLEAVEPSEVFDALWPYLRDHVCNQLLRLKIKEGAVHQLKISVCIPTYNYGRYISQAIESVLNQSFTDFELLVADDSSNDSTDEIVRGYAAKDSRIRYIRHETNQGMVENWNYCLREARGKYIKFIFGDDFFTSTQALDRMLTAIESDETISLVGSSRIIVDEDSNQTGVWKYNDNDIVENGLDVINTCVLSQKNLIGEPTAVMFKKAQATRGFDTKYRQVVDLEMWFHLLEQGKYIYISEPLCAFRVHSEQQTSINAKANVLLVDTEHLHDNYLGKYYIYLSWANKNYIKYDYTYQVFKSYLGKKSDRIFAFKIIKNYGTVSFFALLPLYKTYKPIVKFIKHIKNFVSNK